MGQAKAFLAAPVLAALLLCLVTLPLRFAAAQSESPLEFPQDQPGGALLTKYFALFMGADVAEFEGARKELLADPKAASQAIPLLIDRYPGVAPLERWGYLYALKDLVAVTPEPEVPLKFLLGITGVPPGPSKTPTEDEGTDIEFYETLRCHVAATNAIGAVAARGSKAAQIALVDLVKTTSERPIRRAAVRRYLVAGGATEEEPRGKELRELLKPEEQFLVAAQPTPVVALKAPEGAPAEEKRAETAPPKAGVVVPRGNRRLLQQGCPAPSLSSAKLTASGDNFYGPSTCSQPTIDRFWNAFDFDREDWDDGFGYYDVCNRRLPLQRTFNAIQVLFNSAAEGRTSDYSVDNVLRWAYDYSRSEIDELDARCSGGATVRARTHTAFIGDEWTQLYTPFWYTQTVVERAGTLFHEARHADGKGHNAADSACLNGGSCDSEWDYQGANTFQACYLWWFGYHGVHTTAALREVALDEAQVVIDRKFAKPPGFNVR